jgi:NADPH:quinone reductase-like Zn-dependent oxidoreductase
MRVVRVGAFGPPDVLQFDEAPDPQPTAGAAVVEIEAIGLGYMDTMARRGGSYLGAEPGFVPGYEIAGIVREVGAEADKAWLGRRVFAVLRRGGGCAGQIAIPVDQLVQLPDQVSYDQAIGAGLNGLVAQAAIERVPIAASDRILVRGAGGGIGLMCVQYASRRGGEIVATTSSTEKGERLIALGATTVWNRLTAPLDDLNAFDVIVDTVVGKDLPTFIGKLGRHGRYLICGGVGGAPPQEFGMALFRSFHSAPTLYAYSLNAASPPEIEGRAASMFEDIQTGRLTPVVDSVRPMSEIVAAHEALEAGQAFGKIILKPD